MSTSALEIIAKLNYTFGMGKFILLVLSVSMPVMAAFEPVPESPWLQGGIASSLFPGGPLSIRHNPASVAMLEKRGVSISASRPFGLRRLDRGAVAGCLISDSWACGLMFSYTGDATYSEKSVDAAWSWKLFPGMAAGIGASLGDLHIRGYGDAPGAYVNLSTIWSPMPGIYSTGLVRGVVRSRLGSSGDPAAPRSLEFALGAVPVKDVVLAVGAAWQEYAGMEYAIHTEFSPARFISLATGLRSSPARFWAAVEFTVSPFSLQYGYGEHSSLPPTHSVSVSWGECGCEPETFESGTEAEEENRFPLNVNTATEEQLTAVPGIGPAKAAAIAAWIRINGPVDSINDLSDVPGIGPVLLETMKEYLEVR